MPILESSIALIDGQRLYYRGHDAVELSRSRSVAEVASLVWTGRFDTTFAADSEGRLHQATVRQRSSISRVRTVGAVRASSGILRRSTFGPPEWPAPDGASCRR
jgi:citrate synthase